MWKECSTTTDRIRSALVFGYCSVYYASSHDAHRSTTDFVFNMGSIVISRCSNRHLTVELGTYTNIFLNRKEGSKKVPIYQEVEYAILLHWDHLLQFE